jgi:hypothetical protein
MVPALTVLRERRRDPDQALCRRPIRQHGLGEFGETHGRALFRIGVELIAAAGIADHTLGG